MKRPLLVSKLGVKGLNLTSSPYRVDDGELLLAQNVSFGDKRNLQAAKKRDGMVLLSDVWASGSLLTIIDVALDDSTAPPALATGLVIYHDTDPETGYMGHRWNGSTWVGIPEVDADFHSDETFRFLGDASTDLYFLSGSPATSLKVMQWNGLIHTTIWEVSGAITIDGVTYTPGGSEDWSVIGWDHDGVAAYLLIWAVKGYDQTFAVLRVPLDGGLETISPGFDGLSPNGCVVAAIDGIAYVMTYTDQTTVLLSWAGAAWNTEGTFLAGEAFRYTLFAGPKP